MDRRPPDDGTPGRIIATMVGIVGILLLGSLFWSALGALWSAFGQATSTLPVVSRSPLELSAEATPLPAGTPTPFAAPTLAPLGEPTAVTTPTAAARVEATQAPPKPTSAAPTAAPTLQPTAQPTGQATPTGRSPWVLLPQPEPGSTIRPGSIVVEARARGDAPIAEIQLELDGATLPAAVEQRSDSIWRGAASVRIGPGTHTARATVIDAEGRRGAYRWSFEVGP